VLFDLAGLKHDSYVDELGTSVGDALLAPHRSYLAAVRPLLDLAAIKGLAHITGGGITENLPRMLPDRCDAEIDAARWTVPPLFRLIQERGGIARDQMYRTFNMGVGLILACAAGESRRVLDGAARAGEPGARLIGRVVTGSRRVHYV